MTDRDFDKYIASLYREMELKLIESMTRNLGLHEAEEELVGFNYPQWQAVKLKELRRYQRENNKIIKGITGKIPKKIANHIKEELTQGSLDEMKKYKEAMNNGFKSSVRMKDSFFKVNDKKVSALIKAVNNDLQTANHAALRMINDTYRTVIFRTGFFLSHGAVTEKQAYDMAVQDFLSRGINCIEYKDGRRINIADYTSMAVRTANQRAYMMGEGEFRKEIGETLIIITRHSTSCPLCKPFENKVLIDDVYSGGSQKDGEYPLLSSAMAQGLFHPRCRHGLGTYYPELDEETDYQNNTNNRLQEYSKEADSKAHTDNMVQKYTRLQRGCVTDENKQKYNEQLREWKHKQTPLHQEAVAKSEKSGIIKAKKKLPQDDFEVGTKKFSTEALERIERDEKIIAGNSKENAVVYSADGKRLWSKNGNKDNVDFTKSELKKLKGCVVTHNHPSGSAFSSHDLMLALQNEVTEIRACNSQGVFIARFNEKSFKNIKKYKDFEKELDSIYVKVGNKYRDIAAQNGTHFLSHLRSVEVETMQEFCSLNNIFFEWKEY